MAIVFKTPKSTLNTTSKQIQNLGGDCPPCPEPVLEGKELEYTQNGEYTVTPEQGVDGFSSIDVTVNVPSDVNNQDKTVSPSTSSQSVSADSGYSGLGTVTVNAVTSSIDNNISAGNIKKDVTILGVTGNYDPQPNLSNLNITPSTNAQEYNPAISGVDGYSLVSVSAVTAAIDQNITAGNIKNGVSILGVTGNYDPQPSLQSKSVNPTTSAQTVSPDSGYDGLSQVSVAAVTAAIDANIQAENILDGVTILGVTGSDLGYDVGYSDGYAQGQAECPEPGGCDNTAYVQETITTNGTYTYDPSDYQGDSYDAFDGVEITVNVPSGGTNCPDWSTIGWNCNDITASGIAEDVAYTAEGISLGEGSYTSDSKIVFAPKTLSGLGQYFSNCKQLKYASDITLTAELNTSYDQMFINCSNLRSVGNINRVATDNTSTSNMFAGCTNLKSVGSIDMEGVTGTTYMFSNCTNLTSVPTLDMTDVTDANRMFYGCPNIRSVTLTNTENISNMQYMFYNTPFNLSPMTTAPSLDTSSVTSMKFMFGTSNNNYAGTLVTVPLYDCTNVTDVEGMFNKQVHLTNLAGFTNLGKSFTGVSSTPHILDVSDSTVLTKQSIMNVINNLAAPDDTTATGMTLRLSATSYALLDASDIAIATAKNWSVVSA